MLSIFFSVSRHKRQPSPSIRTEFIRTKLTPLSVTKIVSSVLANTFLKRFIEREDMLRIYRKKNTIRQLRQAKMQWKMVLRVMETDVVIPQSAEHLCLFPIRVE